MEVVGDILYADSYIDLVAIDIGDISDVKVTGRIENIFPYAVPDVEKTMRIGRVDKDMGVVTSWKEELYRERIDNRIGICCSSAEETECIFMTLPYLKFLSNYLYTSI